MTQATAFDLSVITLAAAADGGAMQAFEDLHVTMLDWYGMGLFPTVEAVAEALKAGYLQTPRVSASAATLKNYAFGILKWAKSGRVPKTASMRAFQANPGGTKPPKKRKARTADATVASATPSELTPLAKAKAWCNELQANRLKFLGTADAAAFEEGMLVCLAILNRVKG